MLSPKEYSVLKRFGSVFRTQRVGEALAQKELVIPVEYDFSVEGGGVQEVTRITCVADDSDSLDGKYLTLYDEAGSVGVWIDTDDSGTSEPAGSGALDRSIEVTGISTDDTAEDVASAVATAIDGDSKFTASASGAVVTVTCVDPEALTDSADVDTGFTVETEAQGAKVPLKYTFKEAAVVTGVSSYEISNVTSGGSATVQVNAGSTELVAATAISNFAGYTIHTLSGSADGIAVAKGDQLNLDVEVDTLTAGKVIFYVKALPQREIVA